MKEITTNRERKPSVKYVMNRDKGQALFLAKNALVLLPLHA